MDFHFQKSKDNKNFIFCCHPMVQSSRANIISLFYVAQENCKCLLTLSGSIVLTLVARVYTVIVWRKRWAGIKLYQIV